MFTISSGSSQDWKPVVEDQSYHYKADTADRITHQIQADSVKTSGEKSVFYLNKRFEKCDTCTGKHLPGNPPSLGDTVYFNIDHPQFLQGKMIDSNNGRYHFMGPHHYVIDFNQPLGSSWKFAPDSNITAKIDRSFTKSLFGRKDSVKRIVLSTDDTLLCAKNHGIVQFSAPFDGVNYRLAGLKDTAIHGEIVPGFHEIFDFDTGDVFMYKKDELSAPTSDADITIYQKFKILKLLKNGADTIRYQARLWYKEIKDYYIDKLYNFWMKDYTLEFVRSRSTPTPGDFYMRSRAGFADLYPGEPLDTRLYRRLFQMPNDTIVTNARIYLDSNSRYTKLIGNGKDGGRRERDRCCYFKKARHPFYQKFYGNPYYSKIFKAGLGLVYTEEFSFEYGETKWMIGYVKNGDTTGNIWTNKELMTVSVDEPRKLQAKVFPNPVKDFLTIELLGNNEVFDVVVVNRMGKEVLRKSHCRNQERINMDAYKPGIYMALVKQGGNVLKKKILKQ